MNNTILTTFKRLGDSETITIGYCVVNGLENNENFPDLPAAHAAAKQLLPELQTALTNAKGRQKAMVSIKNDKKAQLVKLLTELAAYVTTICNGDKSKLLTSGFDISGEKSTRQLSTIEKLEVELGPPGEATTRVKRLSGAKAYMHQYCLEQPTSSSVWISEGSTFAYFTFRGLSSTVKYWFRVVAIGSTGVTIHSPVVMRVIQ